MSVGRAIEIGRYGVWKSWPAVSELGANDLAEAAGKLEAAGFSALWLGRSEGDLKLFEPILSGTQRMVAATGIANVWTVPAADLIEAYRRLSTEYPDRVLLGVGAGHPEANQEYAKPYDAVLAYADELRGARIPREAVVLAALGPRMLELAGSKTAGAHPYFVPPEHTAKARQILGDGPVLAPEQKVVLETEPSTARKLARKGAQRYLGLGNYRANLRRLGYTEEDFADGGSDRLIDAVVAWGSTEQVARRLRAHHDAGADHVSVQVLSDSAVLPVEQYAELGAALG